MKICAAQTRPIKGDIQGNIRNHTRLINEAVSLASDLIIFPELSLTGYEPEIAASLAVFPDNNGLDDFQYMADADHISIAVGVPTPANPIGTCISLVLFQPQTPRQVYSKQFIHPDEGPYFIAANPTTDWTINNLRIAPAICYEITVPQHANNAFKRGVQMYVASVAKFVSGIDTAHHQMSAIAKKLGVPALMTNCVGTCDNQQCGGASACWNDNGELIGRLDGINEGILVYDTATQACIARTSEQNI
jgi:predicted amidohydrolase